MSYISGITIPLSSLFPTPLIHVLPSVLKTYVPKPHETTGKAKDSSLLKCYTMPTGSYFCSFKTVVAIYQPTLTEKPEYPNIQ
jgi:hypothetical protein